MTKSQNLKQAPTPADYLKKILAGMDSAPAEPPMHGILSAQEIDDLQPIRTPDSAAAAASILAPDEVERIRKFAHLNPGANFWNLTARAIVSSHERRVNALGLTDPEAEAVRPLHFAQLVQVLMRHAPVARLTRAPDASRIDRGVRRAEAFWGTFQALRSCAIAPDGARRKMSYDDCVAKAKWFSDLDSWSAWDCHEFCRLGISHTTFEANMTFQDLRLIVDRLDNPPIRVRQRSRGHQHSR